MAEKSDRDQIECRLARLNKLMDENQDAIEAALTHPVLVTRGIAAWTVHRCVTSMRNVAKAFPNGLPPELGGAAAAIAGELIEVAESLMTGSATRKIDLYAACRKELGLVALSNQSLDRNLHEARASQGRAQELYDGTAEREAAFVAHHLLHMAVYIANQARNFGGAVYRDAINPDGGACRALIEPEGLAVAISANADWQLAALAAVEVLREVAIEPLIVRAKDRLDSLSAPAPESTTSGDQQLLDKIQIN